MAAFERQLAPRDLEPLHEIGGAGEQHAPAVLDQARPSAAAQMALAAAGRAEQQDVGALAQAKRRRTASAITWAFETIGTAVEVEGGERLAGRQTRLGEMPLDAAAATVGHLVLGERRKEAGRRPAFLVGLLGELGPHQLDARQAQLAQQELDAGGVDGVGRRHAATSRLEVGSTA